MPRLWLLLYFLGCAPAQALGDSSSALGPEAYVQRVLNLAPDVAQARDAFASSRYQWISQMGQAALPTLSFTGTGYPYGHNPANGYRFNTWRLNRNDMNFATTFNWNLFNSFKDYESVRSSAWARDSAEYALRTAEQGRAMQALQAFYQLSLKNQLLSVNRQNLSTQQQQYAITEDLYRHGMKSLADLLKGETDLHSAELGVADAEADQKTALLRFNSLLDRPPDRPADLAMELDLGATDLPRLSTDQEAAMDRRPEILQSRAEVRRSEVAQEQAVQNNLMPTLALNATWNRQDVATFGLPPAAFGIPNPNYYFGLSLSLPIGFNLISQTANVLSAHADKLRAADRLRDQTRQVRQDVYSAYIQLERAYKDYRVAALKEEIAKRSLDLVTEQYRQGTADAIRLAQAQQDYVGARVQRSQALHDAFINRAQYQFAVGEPLWK